MGTQNGLQCFLQKMRCAVILFCLPAAALVYTEGDLLAYTDHSGYDRAHMADFPAKQRDHILNRKFSSVAEDRSFISLLAALCGIERGTLRDDRAALPVGKRIGQLRIGSEREYL